MGRTPLSALPARFDLVIIGGGITGAGVAREAVESGGSVLLVDQGDFASGTSSGSSKLVHGGLRYLAHGQWRLTRESVRERNRLIETRPGLVTRLPFLMPVYQGMRPGRGVMRAGLAVYDLMGGKWQSRALGIAETLSLEPRIRQEGLLGAVLYDDAQTDDARLTIALILEAMAAGAIALNYVSVEGLLESSGRVRGVALRDTLTGTTREVEAGVVVNAAGPWAARPQCVAGSAPELRPLRGSHLIFPLDALPVRQAVSWLHPRDRRPIFVYPWQGVTLLGTTDIDHLGDPSGARISAMEVDYLFEGLAHQFPAAPLNRDHVISSYAGVRPVVASGKADPSAESRETSLWTMPGYVGVTGGKLTTFRVTARQALAAAAAQHPPVAARRDQARSPVIASGVHLPGFEQWLSQAPVAEREMIGRTPFAWGALRWSARTEHVVHLDDLLLRRTRLGLLLESGGAQEFARLATLCEEELGWDAPQFERERARYASLWQQRHALPS